jgi:DNA-directed RNA polymerase subunit M/transcription elongation factor TFIIS
MPERCQDCGSIITRKHKVGRKPKNCRQCRLKKQQAYKDKIRKVRPDLSTTNLGENKGVGLTSNRTLGGRVVNDTNKE